VNFIANSTNIAYNNVMINAPFGAPKIFIPKEHISMKFGWFLSLLLFMFLLLPVSRLLADDVFEVGAARVDLTKYNFEQYQDSNNDGKKNPGDILFDSGFDHRFDFEEAGALGPDKKPGRAGVDDDKNGKIDDCERPKTTQEAWNARCREYLASGSDDIKDPIRDNYDPIRNRRGTEQNKLYDGFGLAGYGPNIVVGGYRACTMLNEGDGLWARALAVRNHDRTLLFLTMDFAGMYHNFMNEVKRQAAKPVEQGGLGIPADDIVMTTIHTHSSPDAYGFWDMLNGGLDMTYLEGADPQIRPDDRGVTDRMFLALKLALANLKPALMKSVQGYNIGCYDPKTLELKRDPDCHLGQSEEENLNPTAYGFDIPLHQIDVRDPWVRNTEVSVLHFIERDNPAATIATVVNYSTHPHLLGSAQSNWQSADYPNYLRQKIEKRYGGVAIFWLGTQGCQISYLRGSSSAVPKYRLDGTPICRPDPNQPGSCFKDPNGRIFPDLVNDSSLEKVWSQGYFVADSAMELLETDTASYLADPDIENLVSHVTFEVTNPGQELVMCELASYFNGPDALRFTARTGRSCDLDLLRRCGEKIPDNCRLFIDNIQLNVVTLGSAQFFTAPMEIDPVYLKGRAASHIEYHGEYQDVCDFPAVAPLTDLMTGQHKFALSMGNSYFSYGFPEADFIGYVNANHPNYYEDGVTIGKEFGDAAANDLSVLLGGPADRYTNPVPACQKASFPPQN
jgi:hypothetical protein